MNVDGTTIDVANGQLANHAQFNFTHPDTKGFTLNSETKKLSVAVGNKQLKFTEVEGDTNTSK